MAARTRLESSFGILGRQDRRHSRGHEHVHLETGQRGRHVGELRQAELDDDVLPFDVAQFTQSLPESGIGTSATSWSLRGDDRVYL